MSKFVSVRLLLIALWIVGTLTAFYLLDRYKATAGSKGTVQSWWPAPSKLNFIHQKKNLVIFIHPKCQCSDATLFELGNLVSSTSQAFQIHALFYRPANSDENWNHTYLWEKANRIPGTTIYDDVDGTEAKLFGIETSGHAILFNESGRMEFNGGITPSRGHIGMSDGQKMLQLLINNQVASLSETPTYGCSFFKKDSNLNNLTLVTKQGDVNGIQR